MAEEEQQVQVNGDGEEETVNADAGQESKKRPLEEEEQEPQAVEAPGADQGGFSAGDLESARQKAAEIAARLAGDLNKRPRTDGEDDAAGSDPVGFDAAPQPSHQRATGFDQPPRTSGFDLPARTTGFDQPPPTASFEHVQAAPAQLDSQSTKMAIPNSKVGLVIGKGGETIKYLQMQSGARIQVTRDADIEPGSQTRDVELMGTPEQVAQAKQLIDGVLNEAGVGGSGALIARGFGGFPPAGEQVTIKVPNNKVGLIIGRGGETIKSLQSQSGARIQVQADKDVEPGSNERVITLVGNKRCTDAAERLVREVTSDDRERGMRGPYGQQGGYRPPMQQWGAPGGAAMRGPSPYGYQAQAPYGGGYPQQGYGQSGYGYDQSGYSQQAYQQPAYQQPTAAATPAAAPTYDYSAYQQPAAAAPAATTDYSTYGQQAGYGQQAAYGQQTSSYGQQSYSGYSGYAAPAGQEQQPSAYGQQYSGYQAPAEGTSSAPSSDYYAQQGTGAAGAGQ